MKKSISVAIIFLLILALFSGCASSAQKNEMYDSGYSADTTTDTATAVDDAAKLDESAAYSESDEAVANDSSVDLGDSTTVDSTASMAEKIIYSASVELETKEFDDTVAAVNSMLDKYSAFIENSYISGTNNNSSYDSYGDYVQYSSYRNAQFVIRVPVDAFEDMQSGLGELGNVTYQSTNAENITMQFTDTQSRLEAYQVEESRLLEMLESAGTVTDMITIESRLSEVRYEIETLTSTLNNWQNQVDYSTITLNIYEVKDLSDTKNNAQMSYWEEIFDGFVTTLKGIGEFFKNLFGFIIIALPVLILIAIIVIVVIRAVLNSKIKGQLIAEIPGYSQMPKKERKMLLKKRRNENKARKRAMKKNKNSVQVNAQGQVPADQDNK